MIELQLTGCENLNELLQSIPSLFSLSMLDLCSYNSIKSLLTTIGQLQHLTQLWLRRCESLKKLQNITSFASLSMLDLSGCNSIESLSTTIGESWHLIELRLIKCENLKELLQSIGSLFFIINIGFIFL